MGFVCGALSLNLGGCFCPSNWSWAGRKIVGGISWQMRLESCWNIYDSQKKSHKKSFVTIWKQKGNRGMKLGQ